MTACTRTSTPQFLTHTHTLAQPGTNKHTITRGNLPNCRDHQVRIRGNIPGRVRDAHRAILRFVQDRRVDLFVDLTTSTPLAASAPFPRSAVGGDKDGSSATNDPGLAKPRVSDTSVPRSDAGGEGDTGSGTKNSRIVVALRPPSNDRLRGMVELYDCVVELELQVVRPPSGADVDGNVGRGEVRGGGGSVSSSTKAAATAMATAASVTKRKPDAHEGEKGSDKHDDRASSRDRSAKVEAPGGQAPSIANTGRDGAEAVASAGSACPTIAGAAGAAAMPTPSKRPSSQDTSDNSCVTVTSNNYKRTSILLVAGAGAGGGGEHSGRARAFPDTVRDSNRSKNKNDGSNVASKVSAAVAKTGRAGRATGVRIRGRPGLVEEARDAVLALVSGACSAEVMLGARCASVLSPASWKGIQVKNKNKQKSLCVWGGVWVCVCGRTGRGRQVSGVFVSRRRADDCA